MTTMTMMTVVVITTMMMMTGDTVAADAHGRSHSVHDGCVYITDDDMTTRR